MKTIVASKKTSPAITISSTKYIPGYLPGRQQPCVIAQLSSRQGHNKKHIKAVSLFFNNTIPNFPANEIEAESIIDLIAYASQGILEAGDMPTFSQASIEEQHKKHQYTLILPTIHATYTPCVNIIQWIIQSINLICEKKSTARVERDLPLLIKQLKNYTPSGLNSKYFIKAADAKNIPWKRFSGNVYQYGWGKNSRLLDSSFTDETPGISITLSRNKVTTAQVLSQFGLPVPKHALVNSAETAIQLAEALRFPVVVKPADKDGGLGVFTELTNSQAVKDAFESVQKISQKILVEKHFYGNDYRLQVFHGEVFWAVHRVPGGVTGDGQHTVEELLTITNSDPKRGPVGSNSLLKVIEVDNIANELLAEQNLTLGSIPNKDVFVPLRRAANVASGGRPVPVLDQAHPDNIALAERAAKVLRLDLAGIDLLIPDIRHSWLESGAVICEVNAQPQLSPHLPEYLLNQLIEKNGRIPIIVIQGELSDNPWHHKIHTQLNLCVGIISNNSIMINNRVISTPKDNIYSSAQNILNDPSVELAIIFITDNSILETGFPTDHFDLLFISEMTQKSLFSSTANMLTNMCQGPIFGYSTLKESNFPTEVKVICISPDETPTIIERVLNEQ